MSAFAYTCHDDFTLAVVNHVDSLVEILVQLWNQFQQSLCLVFETLLGVLAYLCELCCHKSSVIKFSSLSNGNMFGPSLSPLSGLGCTSKK